MMFRISLQVLAVAIISNFGHADPHGVVVQGPSRPPVVSPNQQPEAEEVTAIDLKTRDLSGKWKITAKDKKTLEFTVNPLKKRTKIVPHHSLYAIEIEYFPISLNADFSDFHRGSRYDRYVGLFVRKEKNRDIRNPDGRRTSRKNFYSIYWVVERSVYAERSVYTGYSKQEKRIFADKNNMVLAQEGNTLIMGNDYDNYEQFRMTKVEDSP